MLKFKLLLLSSVYFAPDDDKGADTRTEVQKQRDTIKVETSKKTEQDEPEKKEEEDKEDETDDDKEDDKKGEEAGEDDDEKGDEKGEDKEDDKEKELTAEDYKKQVEALEKKVARLEKRTGRTSGERDQLKKDLNAARAQLEAKVEEGAEVLTEAEVDRRANIKANELTSNREFNKAVQTLVKAAGKVDKNIENKLTELAADVAPIPGTMIAVLEDLDNENGGAVLAYLANNVDEYEEIWDLPVAKLSNRLNKISNKLAEEVKEKPKAISKVPAPLKGIKGGSESPSVLSDKPNKDQDSMAKFVKQRAIQVELRRKQKLGL